MKRLLFTYIFFSLVSLCFSQTADSSYALLKIYRGKGSNEDSVKVKIYNQERFNVAPYTVAYYKIYSTGRIVVSASNGTKTYGLVGQGNFQHSWFINFEKGKTHYMIANPQGGDDMLKEVDEYYIRANFGGFRLDTLDLEEDLSKPIKGSTKPSKSGTGFLISNKGYVITNSHAVVNSKKITVRGIGGDFQTKYPVKLIVDDKANDIALLKIEDAGLKLDSIPFHIRSSGIETGEEVFVLGYPLKTVMGDEIKLTTGVVSSKSGYKGNFATYQVSAEVQPGNSGSPLFDRNGNLIGIINSALDDAENVNYAIKISYLGSLLESSETPNELRGTTSTTASPLVDLVKKYSRFVYIIETEK